MQRSLDSTITLRIVEDVAMKFMKSIQKGMYRMKEFTPLLQIQHLGPIENCRISTNRMMVLDGPQATGKSTIAKAIFFFRTVKDEIYKTFFTDSVDPVPELNVRYYLLKKFHQMFDDSISLQKGTTLIYEYTSKTSLEISVDSMTGISLKLSHDILEWLEKYRYGTDKDIKHIYKELCTLFQDYHEIVYIPAGRSMLSIFTHQLNYILAVLNDKQKNLLDYCVVDYINRVLQLKPFFKPSLLGDGTDDSSLAKVMQTHNSNLVVAKHVKERLKRILKGEYSYINGEEQLKLVTSEGAKNININFASSGQQEALWILNLLYYYIYEEQSCVFIIEEPEAHLYPDSQKEIAEYIALSLMQENECIITTHSPYILGTLNNLLDANRLQEKGIDVSALLEKNSLIAQQLLRRDDFAAYFIDRGFVTDAMDEETGLIRNELIDGASDKINRFADELFDLERANNE